MASKKVRRKFDEDEPPSKEDYAIAKFLRFNVNTKEGKLHSMEVYCFNASAAVDALLKSKWSSSKNSKDPIFFNRSSCVNYCQRLLHKGMFHRAEKVQRKKDKGEKKTKKKSKESSEKEEATGEEIRERKGKKDKKGKKEKDDAATEKVKEADVKKEEKEEKEVKKEDKVEEKKDDGKKKKEKRFKLVMTDDQRFIDGEDNIYVWIYDPVNAKTLFIGSLIVLGAIALCLFPLWPEIVRIGVYYVSLAAAGFVGFILSLVVVRFILFCCIWLLTIGKHHFWLLPNLTEDVGFFESFRPLYKHDVVTKDTDKDTKDEGKAKKDKTSKKKSKKSSDKEESGSDQEEFEMINKKDIEEEGEKEGEGDTDDVVEGNFEDEEDYDDDEQNGVLEEDEDEMGEEEEEEEDEEEEDDSETKKDK